MPLCTPTMRNAAHTPPLARSSDHSTARHQVPRLGRAPAGLRLRGASRDTSSHATAPRPSICAAPLAQELEFASACDVASMKETLLIFGQPTNEWTASPIGLMLRFAEGLDSLRNLVRSSDDALTVDERASALVCSTAQLGYANPAPLRHAPATLRLSNFRLRAQGSALLDHRLVLCLVRLGRDSRLRGHRCVLLPTRRCGARPRRAARQAGRVWEGGRGLEKNDYKKRALFSPLPPRAADAALGWRLP